MEKLMLAPYTRRSRCEVPTCRCFATYQVCTRVNRPLLLLCEDHTKDLYSAFSSEMQRQIKLKRAAEAKVTAEEPKQESVTEEPIEEAVDEVVVNEVEETEPAEEKPKQKRVRIAPEPGKEFYTCKYCGQTFDKAEMSPAQYAQHSKKCKKEHADAVLGD